MKPLKLINKILKIFRKNESIHNIKNILVVSNTGLGDTILATPAITTLRKNFPNINITFLINKKIYPLYNDYRYVNDIILYKNGFINQLKLIKKLRNKNIDTIFLFHSNGPEDIFFSILSGAKNILKMTNTTNHEFKDIFLNNITNEKKHIIEKKLDLVRIFHPKKIYTKIYVSKKFYIPKTIHEKLKIGLQIGSQDNYKIWPIENFIELAKEIVKNLDTQIIIFGNTKKEKKLSKKFKDSVKFKNIIDLCSKTSLDELAFHIRDLDLLITNDTGTMHLAIALQTPTISLFGPTDSKIFGPYQDLELHKVIQKNGSFVNNLPKKKRSDEGMRLIKVDEVYSITIKHIRELYGENTANKKR